MADSPRRGNGQNTPTRARRQLHPDEARSRPSSTAASERDETGGPPGAHTLRTADSRFSLNEQFASSRREFQFDYDEDDEFLEPAPVIADFREDYQEGSDTEDDDGISDVSDGEIYRLLRANDDQLNYYELLGLSRNPPPTSAHIRAAYHRLSLAFHPDKHPQYLKAAAERHFTKLQKAYETLISPTKRVIYDLEGEDGLRNEYGPGGALGRGGEADMQVGVRTMQADEFKTWFLGVLRKRERKAIQALVSSTGLTKVLINFSPYISRSVDTTTGEELLEELQQKGHLPLPEHTEDFVAELSSLLLPSIYPDTMEVQQSFTVPIPLLGRLFNAPILPAKDLLRFAYQKSDYKDEETTKPNWENALAPDVPRLTFSSGISGRLEGTLGAGSLDSDNQIPLHSSYTLMSRDMQASMQLEHTFPEIVGNKEKDPSISSIMQGMDVEVTTQLFPRRSVTIGLGRTMSLFQDTRPFHFHLKSKIDQLRRKQPNLDLRVSRPLGEKGAGYFEMGTGDSKWPSVLRDIFHLPRVGLWQPIVPKARIGYLWAESGAMKLAVQADESQPEEDNFGSQVSKRPSAKQFWHVYSTATSLGGVLAISYARDVFVRVIEPPVESRIRNNGEAVARSQQPKIPLSRGVRLEIDTVIDTTGDLSFTVQGVRRFGDFTTFGLGVGFNSSHGLYITLRWSRLGQDIVLPCIIAPPEETTSRALYWALALPWATYAAIEFVVLRPRLRQKRKRLLEKQRKQLQENVMKRRAEAEQAIQLMVPVVESRQATERERGGLVILNAMYGVQDAAERWQQAEVADVTVALASLIEDSQLSLPRGLQKSQIIGFWDPAPLKRKVMSVDYLYNGTRHHVKVVGRASVSIPMKTHEI